MRTQESNSLLRGVSSGHKPSTLAVLETISLSMADLTQPLHRFSLIFRSLGGIGSSMPMEIGHVFGEDLATEVRRRYAAPVQMVPLNHGIFDEAGISVIASDTVREIGRLAGRSADVRRFRPNVVVHLLRSVPFQEDEWLGGVLSFGEGDDAPAITVTTRDVRCSMVNLDPDSASAAPEMLKAVVRANQNNAGIYGAVTRTGRLAVGQTLLLPAATEQKERVGSMPR